MDGVGCDAGLAEVGDDVVRPSRRPADEDVAFVEVGDQAPEGLGARDGTVLLCLHRWGDHDHPPLASAAAATPGNGLLLFFRVSDFHASLARARTLVAKLAEEPHVNPGTGTNEYAVRDPDGYYVMVSADAS